MYASSMSQLNHAIDAIMRQAQVAGLAIALVDDQGLRYAKVFGHTRVARILLTETSLFQAASLSKPVFAYGVLTLWQQGMLDLDTPLAQLYRDRAIHDPQAMLITAQHVLSHTTGFPNWRKDVAHAMLIPQTVPGTRFGYSGEGFEYLQRVVEHITGQPLHTFLTTTVLEPLGMHHSRFGWGMSSAGEALLNADGIAAPPGDGILASAAWSLLTTAADYARFLSAMLDPDHDHAGHLNATSVAAMLTAQVGVGNRPNLRWGLGWGLQETAQGSAFWHWGGPQNGYTSYTATLITQRKGIVILTNSETGLRLCEAIAHLVFRCPQPAFEWLLPEADWQPTG